eukprot:SAG11_NODE_2514_length_3266_cov_6.464162_2_plen_648_part_00
MEATGDGFIDFNGLGGPCEELSPAAAVAQALVAPATDELASLENGVVASQSSFGVELARLRTQDPAPVTQSKLHLAAWLRELAQSAFPVQAAHAYYGVSRGIRFLRRGHQRAATESANYYKPEHRAVVLKEFGRLRAAGFVRQTAEHEVSPVDTLAIGCVVRKEKVRCVVNASAPLGRSVNDDITEYGVTFPRLREAGEAMRLGDRLWKGDVSDYYLNFPLRPDQYPHTCVELEGVTLFYAVLCFGIRNAVRLAQGISVLITEMLRRRLHAAGVPEASIHGLFEYLDDWLGIHSGADGGRSARLGLLGWMDLMHALGLPFTVLQKGKVVPPTSQGCTYLGIFLDVQRLRFVLDAERVVAARSELEAFLGHSAVSLLDVQRLHGLLSFLCVALPIGNHLLFHLRRLMAAGAAITGRQRRASAGRWLQVHGALRADLQLFDLVLQLFNGQAVSATARRRHLKFNSISDASIYGGCVFFGGHAKAWPWDQVHDSADMCVLEARCVRVAVEWWGRFWCHKVVHMTVDNQGVYDLLRGGTVRRSAELQAEFVRIVVLQLKYDIVIVPHWIDGDSNTLCDAGSRLFEPTVAAQETYRAIFEREQAAWRAEHSPWRWRPVRVPRPDADVLWARWCDLTASLAPQVGVKRKYPAM